MSKKIITKKISRRDRAKKEKNIQKKVVLLIFSD